MRPPERILVDDSHWPLLVIRHTGVPRPEDIEAYLTRLDTLLHRPERRVVLMDVRQGGLAMPELRQRQVQWLADNEPLLRGKMLGTAYIVTSPFIRLAVSLALHLKPPPGHYLVTPSPQEAVLWAAERFEEAGLLAEASRARQYRAP
jgi:hypothetical protein